MHTYEHWNKQQADPSIPWTTVMVSSKAEFSLYLDLYGSSQLKVGGHSEYLLLISITCKTSIHPVFLEP